MTALRAVFAPPPALVWDEMETILEAGGTEPDVMYGYGTTVASYTATAP